MKILIDMNLSPDWMTVLEEHGIESHHWSAIGSANAKDDEILSYARDHQYVVFTHDLDFGTILALTHAGGPSVILVRAQNLLGRSVIDAVASVVIEHAAAIEKGALVVVDESRARVRLLPL